MSTRNLKLLAPLMLALFLSGAAMPAGGADMLETNTLTSEDSAEALATVVDTVQKSAAAIQETSISAPEDSVEVSENGDSIQESEAAVPETDEPIPESGSETSGADTTAPETDSAGSEPAIGNSFDLASFLDYFSPELESVMEVLGLDSLDPAEIESLRIETVFESVKDAVRERYIGPLRAMAAALSGSMVISAVGAISPGKSTLDRLLSVAGVLYFSAMALYPLQEAFRSASEVISSCQEMLIGYIPVFASIVTAAGSPVSAAAYSSMLLLSSNLAAKLFSGYIVPLSLLLLVISMVAPFTSFDVGKITAMLKKAAVWSLSFSMVIYTGILGLKTLVGASADSVVDRSAKFVIGTFVPIVGGALSDAMNTAQGCLRLARNVVGAYGILAAAMTCLPSIIELILWQVALNLCAAFCASFEQGKMEKLFAAASDVTGILFAALACSALTVIISTGVLLLTVGGG
ncbi:MAG TPA: hypothetical protein PLU82_00400 [Oscillospiraceae bacterium]|nr:hypothetical protein [Oscillospiraceae bacterium]